MRTHFHNAHALRGGACLAVMVVHLTMNETPYGIRTPGFREFRCFGLILVDVFFVLSGFIIASSNGNSFGRPAALPGYLFHRFWRLYPTYWAVLAVTALAFWAFNGVEVFVPETTVGLGWQLAMLPGAGPHPFVGQTWTLFHEVIFYAGFGLVLPLPRRAAAAALAGWGAVALLAAPPASVFARHVVSPFVLEFLAGCGLAWLVGRGCRRGWRVALIGGVGGAVAALPAVSALVPGAYEDAMLSERLRVLVLGPPAVLIVYGLLAAEGRWPRRVPPALLKSADASYSLYLLHPAVFMTAVWGGLYVPHTRVPHLLWLAATMAAAVAAGFAFHYSVERPILRLVRRKRPAPDAVAAVGARPHAAEPLRRAA